MKKIAYISGKITGEDFLKSWFKFVDVENDLLAKGYNVINPMRKCRSSWSWLLCMIVCIWHLLKSNEIFMIPDWKDSKGARIEHFIAQKINIKITYLK